MATLSSDLAAGVVTEFLMPTNSDEQQCELSSPDDNQEKHHDTSSIDDNNEKHHDMSSIDDNNEKQHDTSSVDDNNSKSGDTTTVDEAQGDNHDAAVEVNKAVKPKKKKKFFTTTIIKPGEKDVIPLNGFGSDGQKVEDAEDNEKNSVSLLGIILFVINCGAVIVFFMMTMTYTGGVMRTIERRFSLRSSQTGLLSSLNDIVHICVVVFVGYFARKANKPRIISVTIAFSAIGGFLMAAPHFLLSDNYDVAPLRSTQSVNNVTSYNNVTSLHQFCRASEGGASLGGDKCGTMSDDGNKMTSTPAVTVHPAYYFFVIAQLIGGIGSSSLFTLTLAYVDENVPRDKSSLFLGVFSSLFALGPLLGFLLAAVTLRLPENLLSDIPHDPQDITLIGNWWLGYVICATAILILAIPLWFFPTRLSSAPPTVTSSDTKTELKDQSLRQQVAAILTNQRKKVIKEFPRHLLSLLRNKLFMINLVPVVCAAYIIMGIYAPMVRYIEIHFLQSAYVASNITALILPLAGGIGSLLGGVIMMRFKFTPVQAVRLMIFAGASFCTAMVIALFLGCPQVNLAGSVDPNTGFIDVLNECNADCACATSRPSYIPVCSHDNVTYFSSCAAGCSGFDQQVNLYKNCSCVGGDSTARPGFCRPGCDYLIPFSLTIFVGALLGSIAQVPGTIVNFRIVHEDERSFALGINSFAMNLFGFIPGPILFGALIDSACKLWESTCGNTGACLLFDTAKFRNLTYGVSLGFELVSTSFYFILLYLISRSHLASVAMSSITERLTSNGKSSSAKRALKSKDLTAATSAEADSMIRTSTADLA